MHIFDLLHCLHSVDACTKSLELLLMPHVLHLWHVLHLRNQLRESIVLDAHFHSATENIFLSRVLLHMAHSLRSSRAAYVVQRHLSGAIERWSVKQRLHSLHVSQLLQRVWKAVSSSLLQCWNSEAGLCFLQAVHLYGHVSGAHSWHIQRPCVFSRSCLTWNAWWHELQARKAYFCWS